MWPASGRRRGRGVRLDAHREGVRPLALAAAEDRGAAVLDVGRRGDLAALRDAPTRHKARVCRGAGCRYSCHSDARSERWLSRTCSGFGDDAVAQLAGKQAILRRPAHTRARSAACGLEAALEREKCRPADQRSAPAVPADRRRRHLLVALAWDYRLRGGLGGHLHGRYRYQHRCLS